MLFSIIFFIASALFLVVGLGVCFKRHIAVFSGREKYVSAKFWSVLLTIILVLTIFLFVNKDYERALTLITMGNLLIAGCAFDSISLAKRKH